VRRLEVSFGGFWIKPKYSIGKNCGIPAQAGIQMIKKASAKRDNLAICPLRVIFVLAGFPPARE
jgi:hypothetical protein